MNIPYTQDLVKRETLTALVGTYKLAVEEIIQGYRLLESAKKRLDTAFISGSNYRFNINTGSHPGLGDSAIKENLTRIRRDAWRCIVERLEIKRFLSIKRSEELDKQLEEESSYNREKLPPLPEVTEENILAMFQDNMAKAFDYANEAVFEVFDWLRPERGQNGALKTNNKWKLDKKAIRWCVERWGSGYHVHHHREKEVTAMDRVFHMLDGKSFTSYNGPLSDAISNSKWEGVGETEYFKFKCCKNGNLHIMFKRLDLVERINKIAGGRALPGEGR